MKKLPDENSMHGRTLTTEQVKNLTPEDLLMCIISCEYVNDPDWIYLTAENLMRILYRMIARHGIDFKELEQDVERAELATSRIIQNITGE